MRLMTAMAFLALLLAGCAVEQSYADMTHSGRNLDQLKMDGAACSMVLQQSSVSQPAQAGPNVGTTLMNISARSMEQDNFFDSCMMSRGWERK
jgi:hypothetical protein